MRITALDVARRYVGVMEREGNLDHPYIRAWLMDAGFGPDAHDEIPWCGAFAYHVAHRVLNVADPKLPARARSWLTVGRPVSLAEAEPGFDVVVLSRGNLPQPGPEVLAAQGHVGFFVGRSGGKVRLLAGNQDDEVNVTSFTEDRVLGVRRLVG